MVVSRRLTRAERRRRTWPLFERYVAVAHDDRGVPVVTAYGLSRVQAERRASAAATELRVARQSRRVT